MNIPKVGDLATLCYPSDSYPYIVVEVSPTGAKITLEGLEPASDKPARYVRSFPVWDCPGDPAKRNRGRITAHRGARGYMVAGSTPLVLGSARYYRDWSD